MNWLRRLSALLHRKDLHQQTDEELAFHIEAIERELLDQGMSATEAHRQARLRFGGSDSIEERVHAEAAFALESVVQDVRYAARVLRKTPVFAAVVVLSLAIGIGANAAIFAVMNAVMLKSVPVVDPHRLVILNSAVKKGFFPEKFMHDYEGDTYVDENSGLQVGTSMPNVLFENVKKQSTVFEDTFAFASNEQKVNAVLAGRAEAGTLQGVSGGYFDGLGVIPLAGRLLVPSDDDAAAPPVVVIGYTFFVNQLGGDPSVIGKTVSVNNTPAQIVGIAPPDFFGLDATVAPDFWIPLSVYRAQWARTSGPETNLDDPFNWWLTVVGRMKPGASLERAQAETAVLFARTINAPANANDPTIPAMRVESASRGLSYLRRKYSTSLWLLASIAGMVLLVACANVAALMLARTASRRTEVATRMSLGAGRSRVVRQLMTESLLLAVVAGTVGVLLSYSLSSILLQLLNNHNDPLGISVRLGPAVLLFGFGVSVLCGVVFGLTPALSATNVPIGTALKQGSTNHSRESRFWSGKALVAAQIALCVLLVAVAGLMARTLYKLQRINLGFHAENIVAFSVRPGLNGYDENRLSIYYDDFLLRVATLPEVSSASYAQFGPIGEQMSSSLVYIPGFNTMEKRSTYYRHIVGDHYFDTLGIPLLLGRPLGEHDTRTSKLVIVINQTMMQQYFAGQNPIGRQVVMGARRSPLTFEIVGVARDVRYAHIRDEVPPTVYFSLRQNPFVPDEVSFFLRTAGDLRPLQNAVSALALQLDPSVPAVNFRTETSVIEPHLS